jgi:hypothetical protein
MEIALLMLHETMDTAEVLAVELRAIEIIAAHDKVAAGRGFTR